MFVNNNLKNLFFLLFVLLSIVFSRNSYAAPSLTLTQTLTGFSTTSVRMNYGDINNDGYSDLMIQNQGYSSNRGRLNFYFGSSTPDTNADLTITGEAVNAYLGNLLAFTIGDVNGDSFDDLLLGTYTVNSYNGRFYMFNGKDTLVGDITATIDTADSAVSGNSTDKYFFGAATGHCDVNNDGNQDILINAITNVYTASKIYIYYNSNNTFDFSNSDLILSSSNSYAMGSNGISCLDANGDGYKDILLTGNDLQGNHSSELYLASASGLPTTSSVNFVPHLSGINWTSTGPTMMFATGDINNDGMDDFCGGSPRYSSSKGVIYCVLGKQTFLSVVNFSESEIILVGEANNDNFGRDLALYDITNDGMLDLIVGAYQTDGSDEGKVYIFKNNGSGFSYPAWITKGHEQLNQNYGNAVMGFDWDADGWSDIAIRAPAGGTTYMYEITHSSAELTVTEDGAVSQPRISGTSTIGEGSSIGNIQWSTSNSATGTWSNCSSEDGVFDEASENYSCDVSTLNDGINTIYVRSSDADDLYIPPENYISATVTLDGKVPVVSETKFGINKENEDYNDDDLEDGGIEILKLDEREFRLNIDTKDDTSSIKYIMVSQNKDFDGANWKEYDGNIDLKFDHDGKKHIYIKLKDAAGNISDVLKQDIRIDTEKPGFTVDKIGRLTPDFSKYINYFYTEDTLNLAGSSEEDCVIEMYVNGNNVNKSFSVRGDSKWSIDNYTFTQGVNKVLIQSTDAYGNESSISFTLTIDPSASLFPSELKSVLGLSIKQKATEFEINHNVPVVEIENKDINVSIDSKEKEKLTLWERVGSTLRLIYSNLIAVL
ncbi:hypothetical protein A2415_03180 [candidate division WWE3 bacterium RIFOXYC1_FULL_39_7]|uniref:Uncharacterized protein n=1 Tax=candidate division WWE3 bacterium RIFOXYC1_FULL_39_7 TaxID=1802643 RepID=A0A1F4WJC8_UNCKA|nr:MAG: hypothetical protein A2415_03180 [candidate division WWE3 bacterium RIFOXYC1_FULL_39_7]